MTMHFSQENIQEHLSKYKVVEHMSPRDFGQIDTQLRKSEHIEVAEFLIDRDRFLDYCSRISYEERFPKYFEEFGKNENVWDRKRLEHFVSFEVLHPRQGGVYMDVAACHSPVSYILKDHYNVRQAYRQDLNYPPGINEDSIGSNAASIPLAENSLDGITAHNSWEHFEGASDREFLKESARLLRTGGRLCIIPLDLHNQAFQFTSPSIWHSKYRKAVELPEFDQRFLVVLNEQMKQRLVKNHSPETLIEDIKSIPSLHFTVNIIANYEEFGFRRYFLTAEKQTSVLSRS